MKIEKLRPAFQDYIWGGTKLRDVYRKDCDFDRVAESWELSTHPAGESKIAGGDFDGLTLSEYFQKKPGALGKNCERFERFPVLIKFIDAKEALSIQVHPSDEYALRVENEYGKTEMWYVLDCEPGAFLYFGVNREISRDEFKQRIENNTVLEVLNRVDVHPGDVFFIESGTVHAIGAGILICEIQQNSNCTYRVYDYDRRGADGKPRELHVEKALEVSRLTPNVIPPQSAEENPKQLAACKYFTATRYNVAGETALEITESSFASVIITKGSGRIIGAENAVDFAPGDSLLIPAGTGKVTVTGDCTLVLTTV